MKIFIAGASGAVGRRLVPELIARGHDVTGTTHTPDNTQVIAQLGAQPVVVDGLDAQAVEQAVVAASPEVIIHQMTALGGTQDLKRFDASFAMTNRLRTEGIDHLIRAARTAGTRRIIAQGFTGWPNLRAGSDVKTENDPLDTDPPYAMRETLAAIQHLEAIVPHTEGIDGLVLRYGFLYGPGTGISNGEELLELVHKRQFPIVGDGAGIWSFTHIDDAAKATALAVEHGAAGLYNVVDDEPAPVATWLPALADMIGAKPPRHFPVWLGRMFVGGAGVSLMTQARGSSNAKAKRELGWTPTYRTWRVGFREGLGNRPAPTLLAAHS